VYPIPEGRQKGALRLFLNDIIKDFSNCKWPPYEETGGNLPKKFLKKVHKFAYFRRVTIRILAKLGRLEVAKSAKNSARRVLGNLENIPQNYQKFRRKYKEIVQSAPTAGQS